MTTAQVTATPHPPAADPWRRWISPNLRILPEEAQPVLRSGGWLVIDHFLAGDKVHVLHQALDGRCVLNRVYATFDGGRRVDEATFFSVPDAHRFYTHREYGGPFPGAALPAAHVSYLLFREAMNSPAAVNWFSLVSGIPLERLEVVHGKVLGPDDFLRPHADNKAGRGLCGVFYVTPNWPAEAGGELQMIREGRVVANIEPLYNRLVLFIPTPESVHAIAPMTPGMAQARMNYSFWFTRA